MAESRGKSYDEIDAIGGGRVWTGEQALAHGLVDELGNLQTAIDKARELAKLSASAPSVLTRDKGKPIGVQVAEQNPAAQIHYAAQGVEQLNSRAQCLMPFEWRLK